MRIRGKAIGQVTAEDMQFLVDNRVPESRMLEYKREIPGTSDSEKKDFLADVSAFANTSGGVIVYGVETERDARGQDTGIPTSFRGLGHVNLDQEKARLGSLVHDGLSPSLAPHIAVQELRVGGPTDSIMLLGVPRSLSGPHRVTYQRSNRFWRRSETHRYEPDVTELRRMFLESLSWIDECRSFVSKRVRQVRGLNLSPGEDPRFAAFVHVLPLGRLDSILDLKSVYAKLVQALAPFGDTGGNHRFNADGWCFYNSGPTGRFENYVQWFRFGGLEGYSSRFMQEPPPGGTQSTRLLHARWIAESTVEFVDRAVKASHQLLAVDPPFGVSLALFGVRSAHIPGAQGFMDGQPIDQNKIAFPLEVVEDLNTDVYETLRPLFDILWQSGGYVGAPQIPRLIAAPKRA
jgi:hypothetical protein